MKIIMLGPYPLDKDTGIISGGVEAVMVNMAKGLSRFTDIDMYILTACPHVKKTAHFIRDGKKVHVVRLDKHFGNLTLYSRTRRRIREVIGEIKPDIIHTHMFGYYTLAALETNRPNILVSTHGISNCNWGLSYGLIETMRRYLQDYTYIRCLKKAKNIIVNNPYSRNSLKGFPDKRIYELNNPLSDVYFKKNGEKENEKRVLFAGNICKAKGVMILVRSAKALSRKINGLKFVIAGPVLEKDFYADIKRFISENCLDGIIEFTGRLDENELAEEYKKASIFAFPSYQDVAPLALLQAMALGKAVIATRVGGIPHIVDDGVNGILIDRDNPFQLAEKIEAVMLETSARKKVGREARKKINEEYSINKVTENLYRIYKEVGTDG